MDLDQFAKAVRGEMTIMGLGYGSYEEYASEYYISYWRNHPTLHGWMETRWDRQGNEGQFNGVEIELGLEELNLLEEDIKEGRLPQPSGFFFGENANEQYKEQDLEFVQDARIAIAEGYTIIYDSSW